MKKVHLEADIEDWEEAKALLLPLLPPGRPRDLLQSTQMTENGLTAKLGPFRALLSFPDIPSQPG